MKETDEIKDDFTEFAQLAGMLRATDLSAESRVRSTLKNRLLGKTAPEARGGAFHGWGWGLPAAALAAGLLFFVPHKQKAPAASYAAYEIHMDKYDVCGRQGLKDYLAGPAF